MEEMRLICEHTDEMDTQLLLAIQKVCNTNRMQIDYDAVGELVGFVYNGIPITGSAIQQHLAKLRSRRIAVGLWVPEPLRKGGNTHGTSSHHHGHHARRNVHANRPGRSRGNAEHDDDSDDFDVDEADPDESYDDGRKTKGVKKEKGVKTEGVKTEHGVKTEQGVKAETAHVGDTEVAKKEKKRNGHSKMPKLELTIKTEEAGNKVPVKEETSRGGATASAKRRLTQARAMQAFTGSDENSDEYVGLGAPCMKLEGYAEDSVAGSTSDGNGAVDADADGGIVTAAIRESILPSSTFPLLTLHIVDDPFVVENSTEQWDAMGNDLPSGMSTSTGSSMSTGVGSGMTTGLGYGSVIGLENPYGIGIGIPRYTESQLRNNPHLFESFGMIVPNNHGYGNHGLTTPYNGSDFSLVTSYDTHPGSQGRSPFFSQETSYMLSAMLPSPSSHHSSGQSSAAGSMGPPPTYGQFSMPVTPSNAWDMTNLGAYGNMMASPASTGPTVSLGPGFPVTSFHGLPDPVAATTFEGAVNAIASTATIETPATTLSSQFDVTVGTYLPFRVGKFWADSLLGHGNDIPTLPVMATDDSNDAQVTPVPALDQEPAHHPTGMFGSSDELDDEYLRDFFNIDIDENDYEH